MAIQRQFNWLGSQRVDAPHLRLVESGVANDFQALSGTLMAGTRALVAWGATIVDTGMTGTPASSLLLRMASAVLLHATAAEPGAIYTVSSSQPDDVLNGTNSLVVGSFTPGTHQVNYVSLDLLRLADTTTQDSVVFRSLATGNEFTQTVPLGRVLQYRIHISTSDFGTTPTYCPIAKVTVDASGNVESIVDCRQMFWRLGSGGTTPDVLAQYVWLNRDEAVSTSGFTGGDKDLTCQHDFNRAVMQRLWELGGGEHWYSPADDRTVQLVYDNSVVFPATGENWHWTGTDLLWRGLSYWMANSTATVNLVTDVTIATPGVTDLVDGEVIYVELDRAANGTITPVKALASTLFSLPPTTPGSRHILAWRKGAYVYVGQQSTVVNSGGVHATNTSFGTVRLFTAFVPDPFNPVVPVMDAYSAVVLADPTASANVVARGITRDVAGATLKIGTGANDTSGVLISRASATTQVAGLLDVLQGITVVGGVTNRSGVVSTGNGTGVGVSGTGGATNAAGVTGTGGATNGVGVAGTGTGTGAGVYGYGGGDTGTGVSGAGGGDHGVGVYGIGGEVSGYGVEGHGVGASAGVVGVGGDSGADGVNGTGSGTGNGVYGLGGDHGVGVYGQGATGRPGVVGNTNSSYGTAGYATTGHGLHGEASGTAGIGVYGTGGTGGTGFGGYFAGGALAAGVQAVGGSGVSIGVHAECGSGGGAAVVASAVNGGCSLYMNPTSQPTTYVHEGAIYYDSTQHKISYYDGSNWKLLAVV